mgnify:CR=1 FL=1
MLSAIDVIDKTLPPLETRFSFLSLLVPEWYIEISVSSSKFLSDGNKMPFSNSPGYPLLAITTVIDFW